MTEHKSLTEALAAFQAEAPALPKDSTNPHFRSKFTSLDAIVDVVTPLLAKHGLTWSAFPTIKDGHPALRYELRHVSGQEIGDTMPLLLAKADSQGLGSSLTYGRRYALTAVLNLAADEDDDGHAASNRAGNVTRVSQEREVASADQVAAMREAADGLDRPQIELALAACGIKNVDTYNKVPAAKVSQLISALTNSERALA